MLPAHHAARIDQEGLRRRGHAPVDRGAPVRIEQHHEERIAQLLQPVQCILPGVLPVVADHPHPLGQREAGQHRVFLAAGGAPAAPDVEHVRRAAQLGAAHADRRIVQHRQFERRRRLADQRRRQRIAIGHAGTLHRIEHQCQQADEEQGAEHDGGERQTTWSRSGHQDFSGERRKRRSPAVTKPPSAISAAPSQIQRTNGLTCRRIAQALPPSGSPRAI